MASQSAEHLPQAGLFFLFSLLRNVFRRCYTKERDSEFIRTEG